jgi:hypothetical protein
LALRAGTEWIPLRRCITLPQVYFLLALRAGHGMDSAMAFHNAAAG